MPLGRNDCFHFHYFTQNLKFYGAMLRKEPRLWSQKTLMSKSSADIYGSIDLGKIISVL